MVDMCRPSERKYCPMTPPGIYRFRMEHLESTHRMAGSIQRSAKNRYGGANPDTTGTPPLQLGLRCLSMCSCSSHPNCQQLVMDDSTSCLLPYVNSVDAEYKIYSMCSPWIQQDSPSWTEQSGHTFIIAQYFGVQGNDTLQLARGVGDAL